MTMPRTSLQRLSPDERRIVVRRSGLRIATTAVVVVALFVLLPLPDRSGARAVTLLLGGLLLFLITLGRQLRSIVAAEHPELRAIEALSAATLLLVFVFAYVYVSVSHARPESFSEPLSHVDAVYFVLTTISTVGFGDIAARSQAARLLVTGQIVLDLLLIVGLARSAVLAARMGLRRQDDAEGGV
jgi:hypothetical protein